MDGVRCTVDWAELAMEHVRGRRWAEGCTVDGAGVGLKGVRWTGQALG
ncbi:MAG: hypothetical protein H6556_20805 [Lewinellaceae bacterium]|nr:hypothetical protein [Lewinellaceae bacterium]